MPPTKIFESMTVGKMKPNAEGLSEKQMRRIAEWLSGRPLVDIDRSAAAMTNACTDDAKLGNPLTGARWLGWSPDQTTSARFQSADTAGLDAAEVPNLKLKWAFGLPGAATLRSQPTVGGGWLWVGSDNSMVYALDADTGCVHWSFEALRPVISTISIGPMGGSPGRYAAYFGDFGANVYAVDAETGKQLWTTRVEEHHAAAVSGSVVLGPRRGSSHRPRWLVGRAYGSFRQLRVLHVPRGSCCPRCEDRQADMENAYVDGGGEAVVEEQQRRPTIWSVGCGNLECTDNRPSTQRRLCGHFECLRSRTGWRCQ